MRHDPKPDCSIAASYAHVLYSYINGAIFRLERYAESYGDEGLEELNRVAHAHTVTIDLDETVPESKAFAYCGFDIKEGQIRLLFAASAFGSNGDQCLDPDKLVTILNDAPDESDAQLSFTARTSIGKGWTPKIEAIRAKLSAVVGNPDIKFVPNFEDTFAKLSTESKRKGTELTKEWEERLGGFTYNYFETLVNLMPGGSDDFENDEMLKEGFNDAVDSNEIAFRIVDKLVGQNSSRQYCESQVEGGVLYLQVRASPRWFFRALHAWLANLRVDHRCEMGK